MSDGSPAAAIQPGGFVLLLTADWLVRAASDNVVDYCAVPAAALVGRPATALFDERSVHALRNRLALRRDPAATARSFGCRLVAGGERRFDVALHGADDRLVLEAQPSPRNERDNSVEAVRAMIAALGRHRCLADLLADAARQVRALTGYERVVICRRHSDGSAQLCAEHGRACARPALDELLAADPATSRIIRDSAAGSVPLRSADALDLAAASLLAPTDLEQQRLRAAGARALLAMPLQCGQRPWGQVACFHSQPRSPGLERVAAAELFVQMLGLLIEISELRGDG